MAAPAPRARVEVIHTQASDHGTFILRMQRPDGFVFRPGHHIRVGLPHSDNREYSICSGERDSFLEILVRAIPEGCVSPQLQACVAGDVLAIEGPLGEFLLPDEPASHRYLFIATGTGIAPFRAMLRTHPALDYTLVHGVRQLADRVDTAIGHADRTRICLSRQHPVPQQTPEGIACFEGRVTRRLQASPPDAETQCYICGSCDMIYDVVAILLQAGIPREQLHAETYY